MVVLCPTCSGILAWRIPGTEEPGRLPSLGSHRVGHDRSGLAVSAAVLCPRTPKTLRTPNITIISMIMFAEKKKYRKVLHVLDF